MKKVTTINFLDNINVIIIKKITQDYYNILKKV